MFTRITILAVITLFCVFALTVSTDASWDSVYGWDFAQPAWANASVWGFYYYPGEGYVETSHRAGYFNLSDDNNTSFSWNFESEIIGEPWYRAHQGGTARVRRGSSVIEGGTNIIYLAGLEPGWSYTLKAYTFIQGGTIQIKAQATRRFRYEGN